MRTVSARLRKQNTPGESVGSHLSCVGWGQAGAELPLKGVIGSISLGIDERSCCRSYTMEAIVSLNTHLPNCYSSRGSSLPSLVEKQV